jgi:Fungal protein kinase
VEQVPYCVRMHRPLCAVTLGGEQRSALVLTPVGMRIPLDLPLHDVLTFIDECLDVIEALYDQGYIHSDLSYGNILIHEGKPLFIDFQTLMKVDQAKQHVRPLPHMHNYAHVIPGVQARDYKLVQPLSHGVLHM